VATFTPTAAAMAKNSHDARKSNGRYRFGIGLPNQYLTLYGALPYTAPAIVVP